MFSVKCPLCSKPLNKNTVLEDQTYYYEYRCNCAAQTDVFSYRLEYPTEKPLKMNIFLDLDKDSYLEFFWYEEGYLKIDPGRWWQINLRSFHPGAIKNQTMAEGDTYLSPDEAWELLNRFKRLLIFL